MTQDFAEVLTLPIGNNPCKGSENSEKQGISPTNEHFVNKIEQKKLEEQAVAKRLACSFYYIVSLMKEVLE